jgi:type VI secretion system secreted protein Hcp
MPLDFYLRFEPTGSSRPIKGESPEPAYKEFVQVESVQFGFENAITIGSATGGAGGGKVKFKNFTMVKKVDSTSPALFHNLCAGAHYAKVILMVRSNGKEIARYFFGMVFATNRDLAMSKDDDTLKETYSFAFGAVDEAIPKPGGTLATEPISAVWNQIKNMATFM